MKQPLLSFIVALLALASGSVAAQIAVVTGSNTTVATLSEAHLKSLYLGKTTVLPDGAAIVLLDQGNASPTRDEFYRRLTGKSGAQINAQWSRLVFSGKALPPVEVGDVDLLKRRLNAQPAAIGYLATNDLDDTVKVLLTLE